MTSSSSGVSGDGTIPRWDAATLTRSRNRVTESPPCNRERSSLTSDPARRENSSSAKVRRLDDGTSLTAPLRCSRAIPRMRSARATSDAEIRFERCALGSPPIRRDRRLACSGIGMPGRAMVPALETTTSRYGASSARSTCSAMGLRQILPEHTTRTVNGCADASDTAQRIGGAARTRLAASDRLPP